MAKPAQESHLKRPSARNLTIQAYIIFRKEGCSASPTILLLIISFAVASNLDNLGVGLAYGVAGTRTGTAQNAIIATVSAVLGGASMAAGRLITGLLGSKAATYIGALVMVAIGLLMALRAILDGYAPPHGDEPREIRSIALQPLGLVMRILKEPLGADIDRSGSIDTKEALLLGLALALNNVASGVPAGLLGLPVVPTALGMGCFSFLSIWAGWRMGRLVGGRLSLRLAGVLSGAILVFLGLVGAILA